MWSLQIRVFNPRSDQHFRFFPNVLLIFFRRHPFEIPSPNCGPSCSRSANNVLMTSWRPINSPMLRHPSGCRTSQRFLHVLGMPDERCHQRDCNLLFVQKSASVYIFFEGFELFDYRVLWRLSTQYYAVLYIVHTSCVICLPLALMICNFWLSQEKVLGVPLMSKSVYAIHVAAELGDAAMAAWSQPWLHPGYFDHQDVGQNGRPREPQMLV